MARDSLALRMLKNWSLPLSLCLGLFSSRLICYAGTSEVPKLKCQTDFATEVVCRWDKDHATNCTQEFRLHCNTDVQPNWDCERISGSASRGCICIVHPASFIGVKCTFSLEARRHLFKNHTVILANIVKPRRLRNLTVTKSNNSFILTWTKDYNPNHVLYETETLYEVHIGSKRENVTSTVEEQTDHYEIFASNLMLGEKYTAKVRYQCPNWGNTWSDWSNPCEWENDFKTEGGDELGPLIPVVCFVGMAVISTCYISLARLKRRWWDQVPSPAKSKLAKELGKKPWLVMRRMFPGDEGKTPVCTTSQTLSESQLSFRDSPPGQWGQSKEAAKTVPGSRPWGGAFLTPEVPPVDPVLMICGRLADVGPEAPMEPEGGGHVPHEDALADLFLDILGGAGHTQDAEAPDPALDKHPPFSAAERELGGLGSCPGGSSESDYPTSPRALSPAPEQRQSISAAQYKSLLFPQKPTSAPYKAIVTGRIHPQAGGQGSSRATTPQPSSYKNLGVLLGLPAASGHPPGVDHVQPPGSSRPSSIAAPFPLPCQKAPAIPGTVESPSSDYRPVPLRVASQDRGCLNSAGSPYKPLLDVFRSTAKEAPLDPLLRIQEAEREAWPWGDGHPGMEEEEGVKKGAECRVPHVPLEHWQSV